MMPVTAKLSKNFYDRLGEDVANELVEWFNLLDSTYRSELREINEVNFARFDAKLEQRMAELRAELRIEFRGEIGGLRGEMKAGFSELRQTIADARADLIKWSFVFWVGAVAAIAMLAGVLGR